MKARKRERWSCVFLLSSWWSCRCIMSSYANIFENLAIENPEDNCQPMFSRKTGAKMQKVRSYTYWQHLIRKPKDKGCSSQANLGFEVTISQLSYSNHPFISQGLLNAKKKIKVNHWCQLVQLLIGWAMPGLGRLGTRMLNWGVSQHSRGRTGLVVFVLVFLFFFFLFPVR